MDDKNFKILMGNKIRQIRNSLNLTQDSFCEIIELEPQNLSRIENGKSYPSIQTLRKIMTRLNVEPNEIFDVSFYDKPEFVDKFIVDYLNLLPHSKKVMFLKMLMLINEEDKNKTVVC